MADGNRLRELVAEYWKPLVTAAAGIPAILNGCKEIGLPVDKLPGIASTTSGRLSLIAIALLAIGAIRFPKIAIGITKWILGSPRVPENAPRIFRGARAYTEDDRDSLPGRRGEIEDCYRLIQQRRFLILEGESGAGKSSLLQAGLLPRLREKFDIVEFKIDKDDPVGKLKATVDAKQEHSKAQVTADEEFGFNPYTALDDHRIDADKAHPVVPG
jgi:hypothetical protein